MPPQIDRHRLTRFVTSKRICHAIAAAYSSRLNPRNLEVDWYPAYNHTFSILFDFDFDGVLTVRPQYDLWLSSATVNIYKLTAEDFETPDNSDVEGHQSNSNHEEDDPPSGADPEPVTQVAAPAQEPERGNVGPSARPKRVTRPPASYAKGEFITSERIRQTLYPPPDAPALTPDEKHKALHDVAERSDQADRRDTGLFAPHLAPRYQRMPDADTKPSDATIFDASFNTETTNPDKDGKDSFPDFIISHTRTVTLPQPNDPDRKLGWMRRMQLKVVHQCFPVIVEIKGCPSRKISSEDEAKTSAQRRLVEAESELFTYLHDCFIRDLSAGAAIAISAAGPYWRWMEVKREDIQMAFLDENPIVDADFLHRFDTTAIYVLGTQESDEQLNRLRNEALIPILETHFAYPSTMVPSRPRG
ncbi:hypothetical protein BN946_scf184805.g11 [Trametes cinnabarina]|uniref:Uncharacterized protein n=1 Tax=Pycnoporus cinnabarinus TaxID=5643 RepID=A0A060S355_PYCCI|nr:hypothetical protein BN946_scf184805.g11 [Trametes cinnabarina]